MNVTLCRTDGRYLAGGRLDAVWRISPDACDEVECVEASVLWYTEGKGEEDISVHHFERLNESRLREIDMTAPQTLSCALPLSPISYEGTLLRIRWCVRLRMFCSDGRELVVQVPFRVVNEGATDSPGGAAEATA